MNDDSYDDFHLRGIVDIEAGPELRSFFTGKRPHRPTLFLRGHVGAALTGTENAFTH